jgi:hypothetical protein
VPARRRSDFGQRPMLATHNLEHHELFTDEALGSSSIVSRGSTCMR